MSRYWIIALLVALATSPARAQHNTLTKKEITEGWISLFDGKTTYGWTSPNDSKWTVLDGTLGPQKGKQGLLATTSVLGDYELSFEYRLNENGSLKIGTCTDANGKELTENASVSAVKERGWVRTKLTVKNGIAVRGSFARIGGNTGQGFGVGGSIGNQPVQGGHVTLRGNGFAVRTIKLKPMGASSLLNGKDLTGWKVYKGNPGRAKSTWTVEDGVLRLKNGPGDLQTKEQYDDFILQLECKTNGERLNSGIFFRCLPDQYQQGYEAQIHNGFFTDKKKAYTLNVFDPKTHKLKERIKVESTAMDFGTGGIYRRALARQQAAKDKEWFSMTVIAHGRHVATWVNGVQVCDWTDNRPLHENPRQGCRLKKGAISIQGHDPTTDLSFRNVRVAALPAKTKAK